MSDDGSKKGDSDHEDGDETALTKEEKDKCWEAFSAFDKDGSGFIDANELKIVLEMMGQKTTEEEIYRMIAEADAENTGRITFAQFVAVIAEQKKNQSSSNEEDTLDAFVALGGEPRLQGGRRSAIRRRASAHPMQFLALRSDLCEFNGKAGGLQLSGEALRIVARGEHANLHPPFAGNRWPGGLGLVLHGYR